MYIFMTFKGEGDRFLKVWVYAQIIFFGHNDVQKKTRKSYLKANVRKPKGSYTAHKEWAPSVKLLQQNINRRVRISGEGRVSLGHLH